MKWEQIWKCKFFEKFSPVINTWLPSTFSGFFLNSNITEAKKITASITNAIVRNMFLGWSHVISGKTFEKSWVFSWQTCQRRIWTWVYHQLIVFIVKLSRCHTFWGNLWMLKIWKKWMNFQFLNSHNNCECLNFYFFCNFYKIFRFSHKIVVFLEICRIDFTWKISPYVNKNLQNRIDLWKGDIGRRQIV